MGLDPPHPRYTHIKIQSAVGPQAGGTAGFRVGCILLSAEVKSTVHFPQREKSNRVTEYCSHGIGLMQKHVTIEMVWTESPLRKSIPVTFGLVEGFGGAMYGSHFLGIWTLRLGLEEHRACLRQGALGLVGGGRGPGNLLF